MKTKIKNHKIVFGSILLILMATIIFISNFVVTVMTEKVEPSKASAWSFGSGVVESLGIVVGDQEIKIEYDEPPLPPEIQVNSHRVVGGSTVPNLPQQVYCMEKDVPFWSGRGTIDVTTAGRYGSYSHYGSVYSDDYLTWGWSRRCTLGCYPTLYNGVTTYPWLVKQGDHDLINDNDIDLAYILTSPDIGKYSDEKQEAVWAAEGQQAATSLSKEADQYEEYYKATQKSASSGSGSPELPNLKIKGSADDLKVLMSKSKGTITLGPIYLTYINKNGNNIAFEGISSMYCRGYNKEGEKVGNNISIQKIIDQKNGTYTPKYFKPDRTAGHESFVDKNKQLYPDGSGNGEFYIVINDPNRGKDSNDSDFITEIDIRISFQWMTVFSAKASDINTYEYTVEWPGMYHTHPYTHRHSYPPPMTGSYPCYGCYRKSHLDQTDLQKLLNYYGGGRELFGTTFTIGGAGGPGDNIPIAMDLAGNVWEDGVSTKESEADGVNNTNPQDGKKVDKPISGIRVSLYKEGETEPLTYTYTDEDGNYIFKDLNPLLKYYVSFEYNGQQYLPTDYLTTVGNNYSSVKDMVNANQYNGSEEWHTTSKGTEKKADRDSFDQKFAEIGSSPKGYQSSDSLVSGQLVEGYNQAFSKYELMGFVVGEDGSYAVDANSALIDGFYTIENGQIVESDDLQKGRISTAIEAYIDAYEQQEKSRLTADLEAEFDQKRVDWNNKVNSYIGNPDVKNLEGQRQSGLNTLQKQQERRQAYIDNLVIVPDYETMIQDVYSSIAGNDAELWRKLQFIEDSKITSYTQNVSEVLDTYAVYDDIYLNYNTDGSQGKKLYHSIKEQQEDNYDTTEITIDGVTYKPIYEGQLFVNQGLWKRQEFDAAIRKDVYRAATKINGRTVVYEYDERDDQEDQGTNSADGNDYNSYWDISVRMSDYDNYYGTGYNRELYLSDWQYGVDLAPNHPNAQEGALEVFITYKITVKNQSMTTLTQIKEVVDFYDKDFKFRDDLSWVMYRSDASSSVKIDDEAFYHAMHEEKLDSITNAQPINSSDTSRYGAASHSDLVGNKFNAVYIKGLENKVLESGESAYIYLTFQVNKNNGKVILDEERDGNTDTPKMNYAEINGFATFYGDNTQLPNGVVKNSSDVAGLVDRDSTPGNLSKKDLDSNGRYEKNFEDDTDRAKEIRIIIDPDASRRINGTVWEDLRTQSAGQASIGNGIMDDGEAKIAGVKIQLVEKCAGGEEFVWYQVTTDSNGYYDIADYIPGAYIVRFFYGDEKATVEVSSNGVSYNGQDFKSTIYQQGLTQSDITNPYQEDTSKQYKGYKDVTSQNATGTFGYDIIATEESGARVSDAKDLWEAPQSSVQRIYNTGVSGNNKINGRQDVINYSNTDVTNHKAEVLASPYVRPSYNGTEYSDSQMDSLMNELIENTSMTAETGVMDVQVEYDRYEEDTRYLNTDDTAGSFFINDVDFGLVERPKAGLELDKSIANVKLTLANGTVQFDAVPGTKQDNVLWAEHEAYNVDQKKVNGKYEDHYAYREQINNMVSRASKGFVDLSIDEELMHGATIQITYKLSIKNVGEVDYEGEDFYYLGNPTGNIVTTTANQVVDYIANNVQFDSNNAQNAGWSNITKETLTPDSSQYDSVSNLVNGAYYDALSKYNTIVQTSDSELSQALQPGDDTEKTLIVSQLITMENSEDDLTYNNLAEIVKTSNTVGRRMAYSTVGNQNPLEEAKEIDSSMAEEVRVIPPTGEVHIQYVLIAIVALILIVGIVLILKKVLPAKQK